MSILAAGNDASPEKENPEENPELYLACAALLAAILFLDLQFPLGIAVPMLYNLVILFSLRSTNRTFILSVAIAASLLCIGLLFYKPAVDEMAKAATNRFLALFSFWVICYLGLKGQLADARRSAILREREKALEEVRVLRGFLPICAGCKRIKDIKGSWTLLEKYLSEHTEAEFSHGLCPECTSRLFPDLLHRPDTH